MPRARKNQAVKVPTGLPYGERQKFEQAQKAVPLPNPPAVAPPAAPQGLTPMVTPEQVPNLTDPTGRPAEPLTAGLDVGPGPGREALGFRSVPDDDDLVLSHLYSVLDALDPNEHDVSGVVDLVNYYEATMAERWGV